MAIRKLTGTPRRGGHGPKTICCIGDSITYNTTLYTKPYEFYPAWLQKFLNEDHGCHLKCRNFGTSGNTTTQMLDRVHTLLQFEIPEIAIIMGGVNDPGNAINQATTQSNIQAMVKALRNNVKGVVAAPTNLPAGIVEGVRYLVKSDNSTTGGKTGGTPATVTGSTSGAQVWISRNGGSGEDGWSRVADDNTLGVQRIIVMSAQWLHFANGNGDTLDTPYASYVNVRTAQSDAVTAIGSTSVVFFDLHAYQRALITGGVVGELTGEWATQANDQHPSAAAGRVYARGIISAIQAKSGWLESLQ